MYKIPHLPSGERALARARRQCLYNVRAFFVMWKKFIVKIPDCSPFPFGWYLLRKGGEMRRLRVSVLPVFMIRYPLIIRILAIITLFFYWPVRVIYLSFSFTQKVGNIIQKKYGVSKLRQFFGQLYFFIFFSIHPREYYYFLLYLKDNLRDFNQYFYIFETGRYSGVFSRFEILSDSQQQEGF